MKKQHKNLGNKNIPDYNTLKEIIVTGTKRGGDKRMVMEHKENEKPSVLKHLEEAKKLTAHSNRSAYKKQEQNIE